MDKAERKYHSKQELKIMYQKRKGEKKTQYEEKFAKLNPEAVEIPQKELLRVPNCNIFFSGERKLEGKRRVFIAGVGGQKSCGCLISAVIWIDGFDLAKKTNPEHCNDSNQFCYAI